MHFSRSAKENKEMSRSAREAAAKVDKVSYFVLSTMYASKMLSAKYSLFSAATSFPCEKTSAGNLKTAIKGKGKDGEAAFSRWCQCQVTDSSTWITAERPPTHRGHCAESCDRF